MLDEALTQDETSKSIPIGSSFESPTRAGYGEIPKIRMLIASKP